jgi:hypothetical protein
MRSCSRWWWRGANLDGGVDGDAGGGMGEPSGGDSSGVSPLQSPSAVDGRLPVLMFSIPPLPHFATRKGGLFIVGFRSRWSHRDEDQWHQSHEGETSMPMQPGNLTAWELPFCSLLVSWSPYLARSICLKNSEPCSLTLPFLESRSSQKVQNAKKYIFLKNRVRTKRGGIV